VRRIFRRLDEAADVHLCEMILHGLPSPASLERRRIPCMLFATPESKDAPMIKIIICMKRKPGMSQEEFCRYWENEHRQVLAKVAGTMGIRRNVHNHTVVTAADQRIRLGRGAEMDDYDGVAESWFDSYDALIAATSTPEGREAARLLAEDEARFIDFSRSRIFFVEEHVVIG